MYELKYFEWQMCKKYYCCIYMCANKKNILGCNIITDFFFQFKKNNFFHYSVSSTYLREGLLFNQVFPYVRMSGAISFIELEP